MDVFLLQIKNLEKRMNEQSSKQKGGDDKVSMLNGPELQLYEVQSKLKYNMK